MLIKKGFKKVYNLKEGMMAWEFLEAPEACGPAETPLLNGYGAMNKILLIAYDIEEVLEGFYTMMVSSTKDADLIPALTRLIKEEKNHKLKLFDLFKNFDSKTVVRERPETSMVIDKYKGNFSNEDFINKMTLSIETEQDAFDVAMKLEAQALDFYMCNSDICSNERQKEIFIEFAEEEKVHLIHLDSLVENVTSQIFMVGF